MDPRDHWENVYRTKKSTEVSWYQPEAHLSHALIGQAASDRASRIIDVGGGASTLVDGLLASSYQNVTVLDLAGAALSMARSRLGPAAADVQWIEGNVLTTGFAPQHYDVWHDRAVFHFLTDAADRERYVAQAHRAIKPGGHIIVASFGPNGPTRCSGLDVIRYSPSEMHAQFGNNFCLLKSEREDHRTPGGAVQSFVYCLCRVAR